MYIYIYIYIYIHSMDAVLESHSTVLQVTASEGLAQGPYVAARAGFEPATLLSNGIDSNNAPPRPTYVYMCVCIHNMYAMNIYAHAGMKRLKTSSEAIKQIDETEL